ncbi:NAD(P)-binding domain-containing protein [Candidatus Halobeggiatoa sp. HSG11]|nr:NAD(P)-binding domain-containing protein [Candidatus Halobeggiatoa sp. HSG11]
MEQQNIAIIGLGRVGAVFLERLLELDKHGINIICVAELKETSGRLLAQDNEVKIVELDEMVAMSSKIEIIFDLTGDEKIRKVLRDKLASINNNYTIVAPENIAKIIWAVMGNQMPFPDFHNKKGY